MMRAPYRPPHAGSVHLADLYRPHDYLTTYIIQLMRCPATQMPTACPPNANG